MDAITENILQIPMEIQGLLESTGEFDTVFVGMIEDVFTFNRVTATVYVRGGDTEETMGAYNLPRTVEVIVGVIGRGAKPATHGKIYSILLNILDRFRNDEEWFTLNGRARHALVEQYEIFPYRVGKNYITQGILRIKCDVRMRIR